MIAWEHPLPPATPRAGGEPSLPAAAPLPATPRRLAAEVALFLGVAVGFVLLLHTFVIEVRWIPSGSMLEQLHVRDRVAVSKLSYRLHAPRRGDVVVFHPPPGMAAGPAARRSLIAGWLHSIGEGLSIVHPSTDDYIKRVIALPGETVAGRGGHVYVNGRRLVEPYLRRGTVTSEFPPVTVPPGAVWLMGDNRPNSSDSRVFGPIENRKIVGRAVFRIWPPGRLAFV